MPDVRYHISVLRRQAVDLLVRDPDGLYVDATVGGGGHAEEICGRLAGGAVFGFDVDADALMEAGDRLRSLPVTLIHANFGAMADELRQRDVRAVHGVLFDLGVSSHQLDSADRGFSFSADAALDMRMDMRGNFSAQDVVNGYEEGTLTKIFLEYGEERLARRIAKAVLRSRPIRTTGSLRKVVESAVGPRHSVKSLARIFQAIRIEVNGELAMLEKGLAAATGMLAASGRIVVISYHSLEDRIVKWFLNNAAATVMRSGHPYRADETVTPQLVVLTKKPIVASEEECAANPRARSAKLRAAERI